MTKKQMIDLIESCWQAASEARMPGVGPMEHGVDGFSNPIINSARWQTYQILLSSLLPKGPQQFTHVPPREPWQE